MIYSYVSIIAVSTCMTLSLVPLVSSCKKIAEISSAMEKNFERRENAEKIFRAYLKDFMADKKQNDCKLSGGFSVKAESLNSKVNVNFLSESISGDVSFDMYFGNSDNKNKILETLKTGNLFYSQMEIEKFMSSELFSEYFTFYTIPDINLCPEWALKKIFGNGSVFTVEKIMRMQKSGTFIKNKEELLLNAGINVSDLLPYISYSPPVDVNYVDEKFLLSLLSCRVFRIPDPFSACRKILELRKVRKILPGELQGILKAPPKSLAGQFFGTESSCFKFTLSDENGDVFESVILFNNGSRKILEERWL